MEAQSMAWADELRGKALLLADRMAVEMPLGWPRAVVVADLQYLIEGIASAMEFSCTGMVDRHFAWQKVRTIALGGSASALEDLPETLVAAASQQLSSDAVACMRQVLSNVAVYVRHAVSVPPPELAPGSPAAAFLAAARSGDRLTLQGMVARAADTVAFAEEVLEAVQREVGRAWQIGQLTPPEEHLVSSLVHEILYGMSRRHPQLPANAPTVALVRCAGDEHSLGQAFFEFYLHAEGLRGHTMVVQQPQEQALDRLRRLDPAAIAISCASPGGLRAATSFLHRLRSTESFANSTILLGGSMLAGVPQLATQLGADGGGGRGRATAAWLAARMPVRAL
jgi:methanogenic corrinoid protein MtbC1